MLYASHEVSEGTFKILNAFKHLNLEHLFSFLKNVTYVIFLNAIQDLQVI